MIFQRPVRHFSAWFMGLLLALSGPAQGMTDTEQRAYPVPGHGELVMDVPATWEVTYVELGKQKPPLITFFRKEDEREIFQLNISIIWDDGFKRDITSPDHIRELVEQSGGELLQQSRESDLNLREITGSDGGGYYFQLTDANPNPGEYSHLTQGALSVGNVVVIFSLFTHKRESDVVKQSLQMLRDAVQRFQPHV